RRVRLKALEREPFVLFSRARALGFYEHVMGICERAGFTPKIVQEGAQPLTLLALVAAGYGIALIPALPKSSPPADISFVSIVERWATIPLSMAWRQNHASRVLNVFLDVVRSSCQRVGLKTRSGRMKKSADTGRR